MTSNVPYTKVIQWRIRLLWLALFAMLAFMVVIGEIGARSSRMMSDFTARTSNVFYWWGMLYIIIRIVMNKKLLKDRLRLKEQQLRERDEWRQHLHRMSGGWVMDAFLVLAWIAAIAASCYSNEAFYTAYALLAAAALLKGGAYLVYSKGWLKT